MFFLRLAQRVVHLLTVHTAAGRLYEVDVRLRPTGKGGLAVTQIDAFEDYQRAEAWTWEHQALLHSRRRGRRRPARRIRTRPTRGPQPAVRRETLCADIAAMRERMRAEP